MAGVFDTHTLHFAPLVSIEWLVLLGGIGLLLACFGLWRGRRALPYRLAALLILLLYLANPSLLNEKRESVPDVAVVVKDRSPSQSFGARTQRTDQATAYLEKELAKHENIDVKWVDAPSQANPLTRETMLFDAVSQAYSDIPQSRRAGVILLTDGQVHDVPKDEATQKSFGPLQVLLSGDKKEKDRRILITNAPAYGIVGQSIPVKFRVEETPANTPTTVNVTIQGEDGIAHVEHIPLNEDRTITLPVPHAGQNIYEFSTEAMAGELTEANNKTAIVINGVRDRLKVLLVSGLPYAGARTWRDFLTSDPGVDLVHFTILRDPLKLDATPKNELSLIAFPFDELFQVKLYDFDLIVFDRFQMNNVLPEFYLSNIVRYVKNGGALMITTGPEYVGETSLYRTALSEILPARPLGDVSTKSFIPALSPDGKIHPVTQTLIPETEKWGPWLREVNLQPIEGDILMTGENNNPLLILNRVGQGRVAQLGSDQIWLWSRGYKGGGPQADLLRRLSHWLMKEPSLEENALDVSVDNNQIKIIRRSLHDSQGSVTITPPVDETETVALKKDSEHPYLYARYTAPMPGLYRISDGTQTRIVIVGDMNSKELSSLITTDALLAPAVKASGGSIQWLSETAEPGIRILSNSTRYGGKGWIGLRRNGDYLVTGMESRPLLPLWLAFLMLMATPLLCWWREGRSQ